MKVTAILPDPLIAELREFTGTPTLTESLSLAIKGWLRIEKIKRLNQKIAKKPLEFSLSAEEIRELNRQ